MASPRAPPADPRVLALVAAYQGIAKRMAELPVSNPRLAVEPVGFREWGGGLLGALVSPWSVNAVFFPPPGEPEPPETGHLRALPSGEYLFLPQRLAGVAPLELSSIYSPATSLVDQAAAVALAGGALRAMLTAPAGPASSRRALLGLSRAGQR